MNSHLLNSIGLTLLLSGGLMIFNLIGITSVKNPTIAAAAMIFFGIYSTFSSKGIGRTYTFSNGVIFTVGIILFVISEYEIIDTTAVFLPAFCISIGTGSILLFIENRKEKLFLIASLILFIFGYMTLTTFRENPLVNFINTVGISLLTYWPFFAIILGVFYLLKMNKKKNN